MKRQIRRMLMGDTEFSDYSTITIPGEIRERVYLDIGGKLTDVSATHWLLCVDPIIFGCWIEKTPEAADNKVHYHLYFSDRAGERPEKIRKHAEVVVRLEFFDGIEEENGFLLLLRLKSSHLHQFNLLKTRVLFSRYYKRDGMTFDRFKSYVSAYSYPRRVRIVSFRQDDYYNIFPMDLLGDIPQDNRYVFGLRHSNVALAGILATRKLAVAEVSCQYKDIIYQLGKHHSSAPPLPSALPFELVRSRNFQFYIPSWAESYKEIAITGVRDLGSHMLLWGKCVSADRLTGPADHLSIVHFLHYLRQKNKGFHQLIR